MDDWEQPTLDIEKNNYDVAEIAEWRDDEKLVLSPSFQRGSVWTRPAQAHLIDTILRGYPIPPIHIRQITSAAGRVAREIVDGQQRLTAVLEFLDNGFSLPRPRQPTSPLPPWAGKRFEQLEPEHRSRIYNYSFRCEVYKGDIADEQIYEIFSRINTHSVPLNPQELRNGRYFGEFKQTAYALASEHSAVWKALGLFTPQALARMNDAQFVSEALILQIDGMQDKKGSIDNFYSRFDEDWQDRATQEALFRNTMDSIRGSMGTRIAHSKFKRLPLFYTLYAVVFHRIHGIPKQDVPNGEPALPTSPLKAIDDTAANKIDRAIQVLSIALDADMDPDDFNDTQEADDEGNRPGWAPDVAGFLSGAARQTDNIKPRLERFHALWNLAELSG